MTDIAVRVEKLGKRYRIGQREPYKTLREVMTDTFTAPFRRRRKQNPSTSHSAFRDPKPEYIWALKDVSFDIKRGEVIGIIGSNGAGKTTLLKILSRTTDPTEGYAEIYGRVGSLLEVGTGFHAELTGRENIYLNAAILGMKRQEIDYKFDEIVAFAEVEKFLDTPVKRYSSGMYVRLAFAVAAHLEPEILVVDEVLAVGDMAFQKKCLGKMGDIVQEGRTILFVSHNMAAIEQLCNSAMLLEKGKINSAGKDVRKIINNYLLLQENEEVKSEWINSSGDEYQNDYFKPLKFFIAGENGEELQNPLRNDSEIWINIVGEVKKEDPSLYIAFNVYTESGINMYGSACTDGHPETWPKITRGELVLRVKLPKHFLNEGIYRIELYCGLMHKEWFFYPGTKAPTIFLEIKGGLSQSPYWISKRLGLLAPVLEWTN